MDKKEQMCCEFAALGNVLRRYFDTSAGMKYAEKYTGRNYWVLAYLFHNMDHDVFQKDLEAEFSVRRSTISKTLKLMEAKELIKRESVDYDARLKKLVLTPKAHELNKIVAADMKKLGDKFTENLTDDEIRQFSDILKKIQQNFSEEMEEKK